MPAKAVHLISPTYRRWLTDHTEIEFELEGFEAKDSPPLQAHLFIRDLDGDAESRSVTAIEGTPKTFLLPHPKFHRRAEVVLMIEDRRTKEPICEGRWNLTNIPKEGWPSLTYFDQRGVMFHEGVGRFPIVAVPSSEHGANPSEWEAYAKAGFSGLAVAQEKITEQSAAVAAKLKLLLFTWLGFPTEKADEGVDKRKAEVRRLMSFAPVAGYLVRTEPRWLAACRMTDPSRPTITVAVGALKSGELPPAAAEFQDVVAVQTPSTKDAPARLEGARHGRQLFYFADLGEIEVGGLGAMVYSAVAHGAAAIAILGPSEKLLSADTQAVLREAQPLVNAVVRGIPEPSNEQAADRWFWRRRLGPKEKAVIEVKRGDPPTATFTIHKEP